ncbi:MAG TPA: cofactor-independent phosphoglycerate mutase, partial [Desulfomicrobiaceae bacterium]|nr:cofactor-independent phosphoglycerate mutase [Desulfomicrobiaceae bacterium]
MKFLVLVADGMGDWPHPALNDRTPLEAAHTPHMDRLAAASLVGTCRTVPKEMPPGSDVANMALFGFDPAVHHTGRGPIEAAAQGLELAPDDLVWRCNLVTLSGPGAKGTMVDYSAAHIDSEVSVPLVKDLQARLNDGEFELIPGIQYRHLLVQKQGASTPAADIDIRPPHDILDQPIDDDIAAYRTYPALAAVFDRAAAILGEPENTSKADAIWPWGQGRPLHLPDFRETFGLHGAVISAVDLVK